MFRFATKEEKRKWLTTDEEGKPSYAKFISHAVMNNPRGVYDFVRKEYPDAVQPWEDGMEWVEASQDELTSILTKKAEESGNPLAYAHAVSYLIPYNPEAENWTVVK